MKQIPTTSFSLRRRTVAGLILIAASSLLLLLAKLLPGFAQWYGIHIYSVLVSVIGKFFGVFPFSVSELCLYALLLFLGALLCFFVISLLCRKPIQPKSMSWFSTFFLFACSLWFLYVVNCGVNYERISFSESAGIQTEPYTSEDLKTVCLWLTEEVNKHCENVSRNPDGVTVIDSNIQKEAVNAMSDLGERCPALAGYYPPPKGLLFPWILSIQNLTGIYSPFTIEANYNSSITSYNIPFTACHELSHLRGFMQEEEANFIAWLACSQSERDDFQYSASLMSWTYCMVALRQTDSNAWEEVRGRLNPLVEPDLKANNAFWARYDGTVAEVSNKINDSYLKANGQSDGVKSYNRMVDLIVNFYLNYVS